MDKSWMTLGRTADGRLTVQYKDGVKSFIKFAKAVVDQEGTSWKRLDVAAKAPMIKRVTGDPIDVEKALNTKFGRRLSDHTHKLFKKYKKIVATKGKDYARINLPKGFDQNIWTALVDRKWTNVDWLKRSEKNTAARAKLETNHRCGSKSLPIRLNEEVEKYGKLRDFPEFYKSTHFDEDKQQWVAPKCQTNYEELIIARDSHLSEPGALPLTPEQQSIKVFKPRSGYVKGLGLKPSSSLGTTIIHAVSNDYVKQLELKVDSQEEEIEKQNEMIAELQHAKRQQEEMTKYLINLMRQQGIDVASPNGGSSEATH